MTPASVEPLVGARTRAIVVPHVYGIFADVEGFRAFGVPIVEDCAQAVDRASRARPAGDVAVYSFHATKCLTTGEGGYAVARNPRLNQRLRTLRDGGANRRICAPLPDTSAALGLSQLRRYDDALARRQRIAARYREALGERAAELTARTPLSRTMYFRFVLSRPDGIDGAAYEFARRGVAVRRGVDELLHRREGLPDDEFPSACELFDTTVSIPVYPALSDQEVQTCAEALTAFCLEPACV
jgi:UDP-4-amino-4-deoxy-L-arabinose-oxoglutarate aminotransferase